MAILICTTQAEADAAPGEKHVWHDVPNGRWVVRTYPDIESETETVPEGIFVSPYVQNVTNTATAVDLSGGVDEISFYYANSSGDAGIIMVVLDALSAADAAAKFARNGAHIRINPGERSPTYRIHPLTPVSKAYVKSVSALTTGSNELQITQHGALVLPDNATGGYSSKLKFWARCSQTTADAFVYDSSPGASHAAFEAGLSGAVAWASNLGLTLPAVSAGAKTYPTIAQAKFSEWWNYAAGDSFLIHFRCDATPDVTFRALMGSGYSSTGGNQGFQIRMASDGTVNFAAYGVSAIAYSQNPAGSIASGEHSVCCYYNGQTKALSMYLDGLADSVGSSLAAAGDFTSSRGVLIGGRYESSGATHTGPASIYRDIQMYFWPASAPSADLVADIAARLHTVTGPLLASELA